MSTRHRSFPPALNATGISLSMYAQSPASRSPRPIPAVCNCSRPSTTYTSALISFVESAVQENCPQPETPSSAQPALLLPQRSSVRRGLHSIRTSSLALHVSLAGYRKAMLPRLRKKIAPIPTPYTRLMVAKVGSIGIIRSVSSFESSAVDTLSPQPVGKASVASAFAGCAALARCNRAPAPSEHTKPSSA